MLALPHREPALFEVGKEYRNELYTSSLEGSGKLVLPALLLVLLYSYLLERTAASTGTKMVLGKMVDTGILAKVKAVTWNLPAEIS